MLRKVLYSLMILKRLFLFPLRHQLHPLILVALTRKSLLTRRNLHIELLNWNSLIKSTLRGRNKCPQKSQRFLKSLKKTQIQLKVIQTDKHNKNKKLVKMIYILKTTLQFLLLLMLQKILNSSNRALLPLKNYPQSLQHHLHSLPLQHFKNARYLHSSSMTLYKKLRETYIELLS